MALRLKTSGKFLIVFVIFLAAFIFLKTTGKWNTIFPSKSAKESTIPQIDGMSTTAETVAGTELVRLAHWTWNVHQAWAYANKGKVTKPDSIFAKNGITMSFNRTEEIPNQIASLVAFAKEYKEGTKVPTKGVNFFTIMGDAGGWVLNDTNKALDAVDCHAEIIGFNGFSAGEDKFMGLPEWKANPQSAKGGLVAGVAADGDWNIMIFWCAQNAIPFNSDKRYYDPNALNFVTTDSYLQAAEVYVAAKTVTLEFKADGKDYKGKPVKKGDKGEVSINGCVTWTPGDKNVADQRGGLVSIASSREYSNQMPMAIVGIKEWDQDHKDTVVRMLASIFEAADIIIRADDALKAGRISAKSSQDARWDAAKYAQELFGSETADYWYTYYNVVKVKDRKGLSVDIGGSSVSNLSRNLNYYGLTGSTDIGEVVYNRFAKLAMGYYPDFMSGYPKWSTVFNPEYLKAVADKYPQLAKSDPHLPTFSATDSRKVQIGDMTFKISFDSGKASFTSDANKVLEEVLDQLVIAANARVEIHGHTDSDGPDDANMRLSEKRGDAVYEYLKSKGGSSFPANRVKVVPHGEKELVVKDQENGKLIPEKAAENRRVVIKIFGN